MTKLWHAIRYGQLDHEPIHGRDELGRMIQTCALCGYSRKVLTENVVMDGPAHSPEPVPGTPKTRTWPTEWRKFGT